MRIDYFAWACDFEDYRGEGILARSFIRFYFNNKNIKINTPEGIYYYIQNKFVSKKKKKKILKINHTFLFKYFTPLIGVLWIFFMNLKKEKTIYLNFLPLWNIFIFFLLPKKTILGPITGSTESNTISFVGNFIRLYIFNFFYLINFKNLKSKKKILFARNFFKSKIPNYLKEKCIFNFQPISYLFFYNKINKNKNKNKNKFLIYYRDHQNKNIFFLKKIINFLLRKNCTINIIGNKLDVPGVKNFGILRSKHTYTHFANCQYAIISKENMLSYFSLDCLINNLKIFHEANIKSNLYFSKNCFIKINEKNYEKIIIKTILNEKNDINSIIKKTYFQDLKKIKNYLNFFEV